MGTIHLGMMELKGDGQLVAEPFLSVTSPDEERIVEDATVHANGSVYLRINNGRRAYHDTIIGENFVLACCSNLCGMLQILTVELIQILSIENITPA